MESVHDHDDPCLFLPRDGCRFYHTDTSFRGLHLPFSGQKGAGVMGLLCRCIAEDKPVTDNSHTGVGRQSPDITLLGYSVRVSETMRLQIFF